MLIPKNVFPLSVVCDTTANRYALGSVSLERRDGKPTAIATDGKMLVATTWSEDDSDNYPGSFDRAIVDDFDTLIPKKDWEAAGKDIPNNKTELKRKPILRNAFLQEPGANGIVKMGAANKVSEVTTTEGRFPKWRDVMPAYAPHECVEYHCNAEAS